MNFRGHLITKVVAASLIGLTLAMNPAPVLAQLCAGNPTYGGESGILVSIGGVVKDIETGKPIPDVQVTARTGQLTFAAVSNVFGAYIFQGVPPGKYALRFSRPVVYAFEPNPFPDLNLTPEPLIVDTNPCSNCNAQNVPDANLETYAWGAKVPSIMECDGGPCGYKVTVYDYDAPATATNPHCGTDACDGPEDFNRNPTTRVYKIIEKGFTLNIDSETPVPYTYVTKFEYNAAGQVSKIDGPREDVRDWTEFDYNTSFTLVGVREWVDELRSLRTEFANHDALGNALLVRTPNGKELISNYGPDGELISQSDPIGWVEENLTNGSGTISHRESDTAYTTSLSDGTRTSLTLSLNPLPNSNEIAAQVVTNQVSDDWKSTAALLWDGTPTSIFSFQEDRFGSVVRAVHPTMSGLSAQRQFSATGAEVRQSDFSGRELLTDWQFDGAPANLVLSQNGGALRSANVDYDRRRHVSRLSIGGAVREYEFDDMNRVVATIEPNAGRTKYEYNGGHLMTAMARADGSTIRYVHDGSGRQTEAILISASATGGSPISDAITFDYDEPRSSCPNCSIGYRTTAANNTAITEYEYDLRGRTTKISTFIVGMERNPQFLDAAVGCGISTDGSLGNAALISQARACAGLRLVTTFEWREDNHPAAMTYPSGRAVRYFYCGEPGSGTSANGTFDTPIPGRDPALRCLPGEVVKVTYTSPDASCGHELFCPAPGCTEGSYCPDPLTAIADCPRPLLPRPGTGHLLPDSPAPPGGQICHAGTGRCVAASTCENANWSEEIAVQNVVHDPAGGIILAQLGNGFVSDYERDLARRPTRAATGTPGCGMGAATGSIALPIAACAGPTGVLGWASCHAQGDAPALSSQCHEFSDFHYAYDGQAGIDAQISSAADLATGKTETYTYDAMLHLTSHCENGDCRAFEYDGAGNRVSEASSAGLTAYALEPGTDRLAYTSGANAHELAYDAAGAAWRMDGVEIARDAMGRFVSARENAVETLSVYYDADGRRVRIDREGAPVFLHYQGEHVAGELTAAGRYVDYIYMPAGREPVVQVAEGEAVYLTHDAYGRVDGALSTGGHELWRFAGPAHDRNPVGLQIANYPFRNSGRYAATEELHFLGNRTYVPEIDRFIEADEGLERETARGISAIDSVKDVDWNEDRGTYTTSVGGTTVNISRTDQLAAHLSVDDILPYATQSLSHNSFGFANGNPLGFREQSGKTSAVETSASSGVLSALSGMPGGVINAGTIIRNLLGPLKNQWHRLALITAAWLALCGGPKVTCKGELHGPHHAFWVTGGEKSCHFQFWCYRPGVRKSNTPPVRIPFPCRMWKEVVLGGDKLPIFSFTIPPW